MFDEADQCDIAWAAGLFEGEGCITHQDRRAKVRLGMNDQDVVERFDEIVGAGSINIEYRPQPFYCWTMGSYYDVKKFIGTIWPFLGERRRAKATELGLAP